MRLLADCGNTAVKLAILDGGVRTAFARLPPDPVQLSGFLAAHDDAVVDCVVLPGSRKHSEVVRRWWKTAGKGRRRRVIGTDIPVPDLGQYPGIGIDRIAAGLAACTRVHSPVIVVDAGTATTISAWRCEPDQSPPAGVRFLGGLILPGARTAIAGLTALAPALPSVPPAGPDARALQFSTVGAIGAAMGIGYGPMVAACLIKLERETGIKQVLATGGDCGLLVQSEVIPASAFVEHLVLDGIGLLSG